MACTCEGHALGSSLFETRLTQSVHGSMNDWTPTSAMSEHQPLDISVLAALKNISQLQWNDAKLSTMQVQRDNLNTLADIWSSLKDSREEDTKWGDEIEYVLLHLDHTNHEVRLAPKGSHVIEQLQKDKSKNAVDIQREAYEYMVETSPAKPYRGDLCQLAHVEQNMRDRRLAIQAQLDPTTAVFSLSRFGLFGSPGYHSPDGTATPQAIQDEANSLVTQGARYKPLLDALTKRRGHAMQGEAQVYENIKSMTSSITSLDSTSSDTGSTSSTESVAIDDPIYAVGGCAVQVNFGMKDMAEGLYLHDQLCPIGPLMLAITAASPILKGYLIETDARWNHCQQATDDRSDKESQLHDRWGTSPMYFEDSSLVQALNHPLHSDHEAITEFTTTLQQAGLPQPLATYYAHTLTRDPMLHPKTVAGTLNDGDLNDRVVRLKTHLSSLWPHIRLKLPSTDGSMPWIVEFRSMETQPTDFEIAAMVVFLRLLQQTILYFKMELRVPMKLVEENMSRAQVADAVEEQKFWFNTANSLSCATVTELSLDEIFNGQCTDSACETPYPGLLSYARKYLTTQATANDMSSEELTRIQSYLDLVSRRASGVEPTPAKWMRDYVLQHPDYNGDSRVTQQMYYEMMSKIGEISQIWS